MLRIYTFDKQPLKVHNERFAYIPVDSDKDIEDSLNATNKEKFEVHFRFSGYLPLYVENYAVVKSNQVELRSTTDPGKSLIIAEEELPKAIYQYYEVQYKDFYVFYKTKEDLELFKDKVECTTTQPMFTKIWKSNDRSARKYIEGRLKRKPDINLTYYYIDDETHELRLSSYELHDNSRTSDIPTDKIISIPLALVDKYAMFGFDEEEQRLVAGRDRVNNCFDNDDMLRDFCSYRPGLYRE